MLICRYVLKSDARVTAAQRPTEYVLHANGYYVENFGKELFRYPITLLMYADEC